MRKGIFATLAIVIGVASLVSSAQAADPVERALKRANRGVKTFDRYYGMPVRNSAGTVIGEVNDIIYDTTTNKPVYGAVTYTDPAYKGYVYPVPWTKLSATDDAKYITYDVQPDRIVESPRFKADTWPAFDNDVWTNVDTFYGDADKTKVKDKGNKVKIKEKD
jgi:sporulation protein YlmC with PRC-barrel domain